jgi:hypothetical protein
MSERVNYPHKVCPVHGVPMRRVGPLYFCDRTTEEAPATIAAAAELAALRADNAKLQALNEELAERVAAQSELLAKKAMRLQAPRPRPPQPEAASKTPE